MDPQPDPSQVPRRELQTGGSGCRGRLQHRETPTARSLSGGRPAPRRAAPAIPTPAPGRASSRQDVRPAKPGPSRARALRPDAGPVCGFRLRPVGSPRRPRRAQPPTLASAASPEAGSGCPMLDLVEPTSRGSLREAHKARTMPFSSWGSPTWGGHGSGCLAAQVWGTGGVRAGRTLVPVPWASMYSREVGSTPAAVYRERRSCS